MEVNDENASQEMFLCQQRTCDFNKFSTASITEQKIRSINVNLGLSQFYNQHLQLRSNVSTLERTETDNVQTIGSVTFEVLPKSSQSLQKSINNKRSHWNSIKSSFHSAFKSLTKSVKIKNINADSRTKKCSSDPQSWADLRVSPKPQQNL